MTPSRLLPLLLLLASCNGPAPSTGGAGREALEAEVRAASQALLDALNAHDADAILAFYALGEDFTQVACTEVRRGGQGFANLTRAFHTQFRDAVYDMRIAGVRIVGADGAVVSLEGELLRPYFVTRVLERGADGRWLVTWEHQSWPGCEPPPAPHPGTGPDASAEIGDSTDALGR